MQGVSASVLARVPVVASLAYIERVRHLPSNVTVTLIPEPGQRYFPDAIAVVAAGQKVGYVAPEVARRYFAPLRAASGPVTCPARRAAQTDRETSGVELLLDFGGLPVAPLE